MTLPADDVNAASEPSAATLLSSVRRAVCATLTAMKTGAPIALSYDEMLAAHKSIDTLVARLEHDAARLKRLDELTEKTREISIAWSKVSAFPGVERDRARRIERELEELVAELPRGRR